MKFIVALALSTIVLSGCGSLKTQMQNSPMAAYTGPKVFVDTVSPDGRALVIPFTDVIKDEAYKFMKARGFARAKSRADAHTVLVFVPGQRDRDVNVPGQTFMVPVYQPGQQTNYNFYNNSGNSVYGTAQSQGTTQWQTGYREGYTAHVQDQWIEIFGYIQENGQPPVQAFGGQVWRVKADADFFAKDRTLRKGVRQILDATSLAEVKRAPAAESKKRPGCRPMVGFELDQDKPEQSLIKRIMPNSGAEAGGLKAGDEIKTMAGFTYADFKSDPQRATNIYQGGNVSVVVTRDGAEKEFKIQPKEVCPD